jgi:hypothetical protein
MYGWCSGSYCKKKINYLYKALQSSENNIISEERVFYDTVSIRLTSGGRHHARWRSKFVSENSLTGKFCTRLRGRGSQPQRTMEPGVFNLCFRQSTFQNKNFWNLQLIFLVLFLGIVSVTARCCSTPHLHCRIQISVQKPVTVKENTPGFPQSLEKNNVILPRTTSLDFPKKLFPIYNSTGSNPWTLY